jgi:hypothetical protein
MTPGGMVFVCYRVHGALVNAVLPATMAEQVVATAVAQGADYHYVQGIWNPEARCYKEPPGVSFVVMEPGAAADFVELDPPELLQ